MGEVTDIGELLGRAIHEKRMRVVWSLCTVVVSVASTAAAVSWQVRGYVSDLERANDKMRGEIRVLALAVEKLEGLQKEVWETKELAGKALLYAQLTKPEKKP
jgi:hypothetical protein